MDATWNAMTRLYELVNYEWGDPRTQHLPLVTRPFTVLAIMAAYTLFVKRIGPRLMRDRKPFQLRNIIITYNVLQIITNFYIFFGASRAWIFEYSWQCQPIDPTNSPTALESIRLTNLYFWLKIADLLDTVFFVLRKKNSHISFLHVYHHSMMILVGWHGIKYFAVGHATLLGLVNTLVHGVMYTYYLASVIEPRSAWWKKYVTQLQLVQHVVVGLHEAQLLVYNPCGFPLYAPLMLSPQAVLLVVLFLDFYRHAYGTPTGKAEERKAK